MDRTMPLDRGSYRYVRTLIKRGDCRSLLPVLKALDTSNHTAAGPNLAVVLRPKQHQSILDDTVAEVLAGAVPSHILFYCHGSCDGMVCGSGHSGK